MEKKAKTLRKCRIMTGIMAALLIFLFAPRTGQQAYAYVAGNEQWGVVPCPTCGETNTDVVLISEATCTQGEISAIYCWDRTCPASGNYVQVTTSGPLGHSYKTTSEKAATCTAGGSKEQKCSRCGKTTSEKTAALGHSYSGSVTREATCISAGEKTYTCGRCGDSYKESIAALGHDYKKEEVTEPTCTEKGETVYTCSRCGDSYKKSQKSLGHDYKEKQISEVSCIEDGVTEFTCKRCGDKYEEREEAYGHLFISKVTKDPTCTESGEKELECIRCDLITTEEIEASGHTYPEEWTTTSEAGWFHEGSEMRACTVCQNREEREVPHTMDTKTAAGLLAAAVAALGGIGIALSNLLKAKTAAKGLTGNKYTLDNRKIVMCMEENEYNRSLIDTFLGKPYLKVTETNREEFNSVVKRIAPDLVVLSAETREDLEGIEARIKAAKEENDGGSYALIVESSLMESSEELLESLKEKEVIDTYMDKMRSTLIVLVHLVLPMYKPDLKSDEGVALIGSVGDALGIPGVSLLMNVILTKHDIEDRIGNDDRALSEDAAIIGDIASILGLDMVEGIASYIMQEDVIKDTAAIHKRRAEKKAAKEENAEKTQ